MLIALLISSSSDRSMPCQLAMHVGILCLNLCQHLQYIVNFLTINIETVYACVLLGFIYAMYLKAAKGMKAWKKV